MEIDNYFPDISMDYTIQKFESEEGNNYPSVKGRLKKKIESQKRFQLTPQLWILLIIATRFLSLKHLNALHFTLISQL